MQSHKNLISIGRKDSGKSWLLNKLLCYDTDDVLFRTFHSADSSELIDFCVETRTVTLNDEIKLTLTALDTRGINEGNQGSLHNFDKTWTHLKDKYNNFDKIILVVNYKDFKSQVEENLQALDRLSRYLDVSSTILVINQVPNEVKIERLRARDQTFNLEKELNQMRAQILHAINKELASVFTIENDIGENGEETNSIVNQQKFNQIRQLFL